MKFTPRRTFVLPVLLMLGMLLGIAGPTLAIAQDDASRFAELLAAREGTVPEAGPFSGELVQNEATVSGTAAGVSVTDFSASVIASSPGSTSAAPWDIGFSFHQAGDASQRIYIDSGGSWFYVSYPEGVQDSGTTAAFDASPGAENAIDLIVEGETALFGVNGVFVASVTLPAAAQPSDVLIGTGYVGRTTEPDRTIAYRNFAVWPVPTGDEADSSNVVQITVTPEVVETPEGGTEETGVLSDAEAFSALIDAQFEATTLTGPFNATLKEETSRVAQSWAGVDLATFHATALFDVPQAASETPWEIGYTFGSSPTGAMHLTIDSLGNWYFSVGSQGPSSSGTVPGLVTAAGMTNQLDLFVAEQRAVFGVNGIYAADIDLPADYTSGDVAVSTGVFNDQTMADRVTYFSNFTVLDFNPLVAAPDTGLAPLSDADMADFASYVDDTRAVTPQSGPFSGRLVEVALGTVPQAPSGTFVSDFGAVATFINPDDVDVAFWDGGFQFRTLGEALHRVAVRSTGEVYLDLPDGSTTLIGIASGYDPAPGARNELQLFVDGDRALFGVNDALAAVIMLPNEPIESDVLVGVAYFSEDFVQGRITTYEGFSVWQMA